MEVVSKRRGAQHIRSSEVACWNYYTLFSKPHPSPLPFRESWIRFLTEQQTSNLIVFVVVVAGGREGKEEERAETALAIAVVFVGFVQRVSSSSSGQQFQELDFDFPQKTKKSELMFFFS